MQYSSERLHKATCGLEHALTHLRVLLGRARSVVFMAATGPQPKDRNCTFIDAIHACKGVNCEGQVSQFDKAQTLLRQDWVLGEF